MPSRVLPRPGWYETVIDADRVNQPREPLRSGKFPIVGRRQQPVIWLRWLVVTMLGNDPLPQPIYWYASRRGWMSDAKWRAASFTPTMGYVTVFLEFAKSGGCGTATPASAHLEAVRLAHHLAFLQARGYLHSSRSVNPRPASRPAACRRHSW